MPVPCSFIRSQAHWHRLVRALTKYIPSPNGSRRTSPQSAWVWSIATYSLPTQVVRPSVLICYPQVPGTIVGEAHLGSSEIEIGMGIHNEAGVQHVSPVPPLNKLLQTLLDLLLSQSDPERGFLPILDSGKAKVVLLVNNLGGVSELELGGIVREATAALLARGVAVLRVISGTFMVTQLGRIFPPAPITYLMA